MCFHSPSFSAKSGHPFNTLFPMLVLDKSGSDTSSTLTDFSESLRTELDQKATDSQKEAGYFFHISGYQEGPDGFHPEFHHVTNYTIDTDGNYQVTQAPMRRSEDFWTVYGGRPLDQVFANRFGQIFCNGFPSGRQVYFALLQRMAELRAQVWGNPNWRFRPPNSIDEEADLLRLDMEQINAFFRQSNYSAPFIGGPIETLNIPRR
jgi:hypothetical protein